LARRRAWQQRLVYGGVLALACSLLAWVVGVSLPLHLGLVALGFLIGAGWRFKHTGRQAEAWSFGWIEARAGLAYLTAFELPEGDAHGLAGAVQTRAAKAASLDTPPLQPWALPLLVLAFALALVPHLALPALRAPLSPPAQTALTPAALTPAETVPGLEQDATARDAATTGTATPETGTPADPETTTGNPDAERSFDTAGSADEGLGEAAGEQAALDRFLEQTEAAEVSAMQTQQGPSESAAPQEGAQLGGATGEGEAGPGGEAADRRSASATPSEGDGSADTPSGEGEGIEREAASGQDPSSEGEPGQQGGEPGLSDTDEEERVSTEGPQVPQETPRTNEPQRAQAAAEATDRQNESLARTGEPTVQRSATSDENSPTTQDIRDGQSSERGGTRAGADIESSRERLGGPDRAPERISGIRGEGPTTAGGEALQQGQAPGTLPRTGTPESYRRAAEEVIREGRIPLEYQEIVRDYFR